MADFCENNIEESTNWRSKEAGTSLNLASKNTLSLHTALPTSYEAERAIAITVIHDPGALAEATQLGLTADHFYFSEWRNVWEAVINLSVERTVLNSITVRNWINRFKKLSKEEEAAIYALLDSQENLAAHIAYSVRIVINKAALRRLIMTTSQINAAARSQEQDIEELLDQAEQEILAIRATENTQGIIKMHDLVRQVLHRIQNSTGDQVTGVPSGFSDLDEVTCGFQPGELIIIAARPSMGKTAFVLNVAANIAIHAGLPAAFFSLEMSAEQLTQRMVGSESRVDLMAIRRGTIDSTTMSRLTMTAGRIGESPIYIDETASITVAQLRSKCRRLVHQHGVKIVIIDYLQLMGSSRNFENKATEIAEISKGLKALAREFKIPVIALSQLNRGVESRTDKRPMMSDLRESGAIEQDADVIAFLYREEYYLRDKTPADQVGLAELIVAKNRNGPTKNFQLRFFNNIACFQSLSHRSES